MSDISFSEIKLACDNIRKYSGIPDGAEIDIEISALNDEYYLSRVAYLDDSISKLLSAIRAKKYGDAKSILPEVRADLMAIGNIYSIAVDAIGRIIWLEECADGGGSERSDID